MMIYPWLLVGLFDSNLFDVVVKHGYSSKKKNGN